MIPGGPLQRIPRTPGFLGTGEHGRAIVAERQRVGQQPQEFDNYWTGPSGLPRPGGDRLERLGASLLDLGPPTCHTETKVH